MGARSYIQDRGFLFVVKILLQASILETTPTVITLDFYIKTYSCQGRYDLE
jgi:hypothetical protein